MTKIFFHVGAHKTATTLIQRALFSNQDYLHTKNVLVITKKTHPTLDLYSKEAIETEIKDKNVDTVIISYEGYLSTLGHIIKSKRKIYTDLPKAFKTISELKEARYDVKVILYIRKPSSFIESSYLEYVSSGHALRFKDFIGSVDLDKFTWRNVIRDMKLILPNESIFIRKFENEISKGSQAFLNRFASLIKTGLKLKYLDQDNQNRSFSELALKVALSSYNVLEPEERKKLSQVLKRELSNRELPKPSLLSDSEKVAIDEKQGYKL